MNMAHQPAQSDLFQDSTFALFMKFHKENPRVFKLFEMFTMQAINSGKKQYGARAVFERVRWETEIITKGDEFKINNNYIPYYARLFIAVHPEHSGFFELRKRIK